MAANASPGTSVPLLPRHGVWVELHVRAWRSLRARQAIFSAPWGWRMRPNGQLPPLAAGGFFSTQRALLLMAVVGALLLCSVVAFDLHHEYQRELHDATTAADRLTRLLEEEARQTLRRVELSLQEASAELQGVDVNGAHGRELAVQRLAGHLPHDHLILGYTLIAKSGSYVLSTLVPNPETLPQALDRDYFALQLNGAARGLVLGRAVRGRLSGKWLVPVSMRLLDAHGAFAGILVALLDPQYLQSFYQSIDVGRDGFVTLFSQQGWVLARFPFVEAMAQRNWSDSPMFRKLLPKASADTVRQVVVADGVERIYSYRALSDYPVIVTLGFSLDQWLAPWRVRAAMEGGFLLLVLVLLAWCTRALVRQIRRAQQAESALYLSELSVQKASMPTLWIARDARIVRANQAACDLWGFSQAELLTKRITELDPDFPPERWPLHWAELRETRQMRFQTRQTNSAGKVFPVEVDLNFLEFQGEEINFAFVRDLRDSRPGELT